MIMDPGLTELPGIMNGFKFDSVDHENLFNEFKLEGVFLDQDFTDLPFDPPDPNPNLSAPSSSISTVGESPEDYELYPFSPDTVLNYINTMLMEEDMEEKNFSSYQESAALQAAEKPFYDILGEKYPPLSDGPISPDDYVSDDGSRSTDTSLVSYQFASESLSSNSIGSVCDGLEESAINKVRVPDMISESEPIWQFRRGVEEANKFLPNDNNLIIDVSKNMVKEEREYSVNGLRGRKNPYREEDLDSEEGRSNKQSAVYSEENERSAIFDKVLLCFGEKCGVSPSSLQESMQNEVSKSSQNGQSKGLDGSKGRGKKQGKKEVVDLRTLLMHCAQTIATNDLRSARDLLNQIRQHSSPFGDGSQRLAHCFADGLEARLAGTGSQIYNALSTKRKSATDILKAYQLYLAACPFKIIAHFFSNHTILAAAENATRLHIIHFGIDFGFQWPCFIKKLSGRTGGPPKLRITGIDHPQTGLQPAEKVEATGRRLADYARSFKVPFEYKGIVNKWENIRVEDLEIVKGEVLVVNCLFQLKNLPDETVNVDSPRDAVLNTIRKMNPDVFIHGIVNGAYGAPFFVTRFREALYHFSALFDMLDMNVPREHPERILIEREIFRQEAMSVISCEGSERVARPETYKQWQVRNHRAGLVQNPLNREIVKLAKEKVRSNYSKDFVIDEDGRWMLQGWKGRILFALSTWRAGKPGS
eukprot:TRINITY_DN3110_c0_g1_i1.p1 TRINITY_DN3110_c0_g1~~TRINITY_DN3110_c0_g1_i1.p1  ORF type:complete len:703 (-),score=106.56 TRINITY_DN3110_c0_g1_i1:139-2247(-)